MDRDRLMELLRDRFPARYCIPRDEGRERMVEELALGLEVTQREAEAWLDGLEQSGLIHYSEPAQSNEAALLSAARYGDLSSEDPNRSGCWMIGVDTEEPE